MTQLGQSQFSATTLPDLLTQLNAWVSKLQQGALWIGGIKLDTSRTTAPMGAPGPGDPNVVVVNVAGTVKLYIYDGTNWVTVGSQV